MGDGEVVGLNKGGRRAQGMVVKLHAGVLLCHLLELSSTGYG